MKKAVLAVFLIVSGVGVFAQNGVIKELSGEVELKNSGSASFVPAKAGDVVKQETVISTGFKSSALIEVGSALLTVRPLTRLSLQEISASTGSESLNVSLQSGRVRVDLKPPAGARAAMQVISPSATASVRGTSFEFDTRNLHVYEGNVVFKGTRGEGALITAGFNSGITEKGNSVNPAAFGDGAYKPQMPEGAGTDTAPAAIPTGNAPSGGNTDVGVVFK